MLDRNASMVIKIIAKLGHQRIVKIYDFIVNLIPKRMKNYKSCINNGQKILHEKTLDHLSGYKNSKPVRVGNAAYLQSK